MKELRFSELLKPEFVCRGKPFDWLDEMYKKLNVVEIPPYLSDEESITLLKKGLICVSSIFAQDMRNKAHKEMERRI